jgi:hypothetical protein
VSLFRRARHIFARLIVIISFVVVAVSLFRHALHIFVRLIIMILISVSFIVVAFLVVASKGDRAAVSRRHGWKINKTTTTTTTSKKMTAPLEVSSDPESLFRLARFLFPFTLC